MCHIFETFTSPFRYLLLRTHSLINVSTCLTSRGRDVIAVMVYHFQVYTRLVFMQGENILLFTWNSLNDVPRIVILPLDLYNEHVFHETTLLYSDGFNVSQYLRQSHSNIANKPSISSIFNEVNFT